MEEELEEVLIPAQNRRAKVRTVQESDEHEGAWDHLADPYLTPSEGR